MTRCTIDAAMVSSRSIMSWVCLVAVVLCVLTLHRTRVHVHMTICMHVPRWPAGLHCVYAMLARSSFGDAVDPSASADDEWIPIV